MRNTAADDANDTMPQTLRDGLRRAGISDAAGAILYVDSARQAMQLWRERRLLAEYAVSTARRGLGNSQGSHKTPPGAHKIMEKIGHGAPANMIFRGRRPTGQLAVIEPADKDTGRDAITGRILRLAGLERQNRDSYARHIYIHGTNEEGRIGRPVSHGCVRMRNADIIELYRQVHEGDVVVIV